MDERDSARRAAGKGAIPVACAMLALVGLFFLLREHWGHVIGWWPYLLLLACPLLHVFMHGSHGHGRHDDHRES